MMKVDTKLEREYEKQVQDFMPIIIDAARKAQEARDPVLLGQDDLMSHGKILLWNIMLHHPDVRGDDLARKFKHCIYRLMAGLRRAAFYQKRNNGRVIPLADLLRKDEEDALDDNREADLPDSHTFSPRQEASANDIRDQIRMRLNPLEIRILDELLEPSEELVKFCHKQPTRRRATTVPIYHMAQFLGADYQDVKSAITKIRVVAQEVTDCRSVSQRGAVGTFVALKPIKVKNDETGNNYYVSKGTRMTIKMAGKSKKYFNVMEVEDQPGRYARYVPMDAVAHVTA